MVDAGPITPFRLWTKTGCMSGTEEWLEGGGKDTVVGAAVTDTAPALTGAGRLPLQAGGLVTQEGREREEACPAGRRPTASRLREQDKNAGGPPS